MHVEEGVGEGRRKGMGYQQRVGGEDERTSGIAVTPFTPSVTP